MGSYGGYYKGEKKKLKRDALEKQVINIKHSIVAPQVKIIGKGKSKGK